MQELLKVSSFPPVLGRKLGTARPDDFKDSSSVGVAAVLMWPGGGRKASVKPADHIVGQLVVGRFTTSKAISRFAMEADLPGVGIDPEIQAWAGFKVDGQRPSLWQGMTYTELFTRNNLENMALFSGIEPPGGFTTFDPPEAM